MATKKKATAKKKASAKSTKATAKKKATARSAGTPAKKAAAPKKTPVKRAKNTARKAKATGSKANGAGLTQDEISERATQLWQQRGGGFSSPEQMEHDWALATQQLQSEKGL